MRVRNRWQGGGVGDRESEGAGMEEKSGVAWRIEEMETTQAYQQVGNWVCKIIGGIEGPLYVEPDIVLALRM